MVFRTAYVLIFLSEGISVIVLRVSGPSGVCEK